MIFGNNVNFRAKPEMNATVCRQSFLIILSKVTETIKDKKEPEKDAWYKIKTLGGKTGFVKAEFVRSPIDYRAGFEKRNGKWKMMYFYRRRLKFYDEYSRKIFESRRKLR